VTELAEAAGLFAEPSKIGTKLAWVELLAGAGLKIAGTTITRA
jgi:hypothetical protein